MAQAGGADIPTDVASNKLNSAIVKPHPFFLCLLLTLLLLGSQQMGLAHAIAHLGEESQRASQVKQVPADKLCERCLAFAQVGTAVDTAPLRFLVPVLEESVQLVNLAHSAPPATRCCFLSRAPPAPL